MLALMPQVCEKYDIVPMTLMNIDSSDMTISDQKRIADTVNDNIGKYDGIVITHGTDTMAYTAAALSVMTENPPVPVVLTGSQRPFFESGSDAPANFEDALAAAGSGTVCRVCVVFGGKIMDGRDCTKIDTVSDNAFTCVKGDIGTVKSDRVKITCNEPRCPVNTGMTAHALVMDSKILVFLDMHPSFNPDMIKMLYEGGISGFVIRCYGAGGIPERVRAALGRVIAVGAKAIAVTQCLYGGVDLGIYAVGTDARKAGISDGGYMTTEYAVAWMMRGGEERLMLLQLILLCFRHSTKEIYIQMFLDTM